MKNSKRIVAIAMALVLLTLGTLFSAGAATIFGVEIAEEKDENLKWLSYANGKNAGVNCVYLPPASLIAEDGYVVVTDETPLSFDYTLSYWEDEAGNAYYPGQEYYVTGMDTLYAVWQPKEDNDARIVRIVKTAVEALVRIFSHLRYYVTIVEDFSREYNERTTSIEATTFA